MGKVDFRALCRKERPVFHEAFSDPEQPGVTVELRIGPVAPSSVLDLWRADEEERLVRQHITGLVDAQGALVLGKDKKPIQGPTDFVMFDGPWIPPGILSRLLFRVAAQLAAYEKAGDKPAEEQIGSEDFVRMALTMPQGWHDACAWVNAVMGPAGNSGGAAETTETKEGEGSSAPPSASDSPIPS